MATTSGEHGRAASGAAATAAAPRRARLRRTVWTLAALGLVLILLRSFVADSYGIKSGSMRPTLFGGAAEPGGPEFREHVLVRHDRAPRLERFDLVVLSSGGGGPPLVKRVVGLPGETLSIRDGDLMIDGERLPPHAPRPEPILVFDDRLHGARGFFDFGLAPEGPWSREGDAWTVDARTVAPGAQQGMMQLRRGMHDDYLDQDDVPVRGSRPVNDAILEAEVRIGPAAREGAALRLTLVEGADTFVALLEPGFQGRPARARLLRYNPRTLARTDAREKQELLAEAAPPLPHGLVPETWRRLRFANVDNHLSLTIDGTSLLEADYEANEELPSPGPGTSSRGARVGLGGEGLVAGFRGLRVLRDLYYTDAGTYGTSTPARLGLDETFVLGDNSAASTDSRTLGPMPASRILGRPLAVVWPPSRLRWLRGAAR